MKIFLFVLVLWMPHAVLSQPLSGSAGKDRHFCFHSRDSFSISPISLMRDSVNDTLGSYPTAFGGTPPYKYRWTTYPEIYDISFIEENATRFLSDYTHPNPKIIKVDFRIFNPKQFFLTVTDSLGNKFRDTISISFFNHIPLIRNFSKKKFDTLSLNTYTFPAKRGSTISFHWETTNFSSDTIGESIRVWNKEDKIIKHWLTDNYGCKSNVFDIFVSIDTSSGIQSIQSPFASFSINAQMEIVCEAKTEAMNDLNLQIVDMNGKLIYQNAIAKESLPFSLKPFLKSKTIYMIIIRNLKTNKPEWSAKLSL